MSDETIKNASDPETEAIALISRALAGLPDERKLAVLSYVHGRFGGIKPGSLSSIDANADSTSGITEDIKAFLKLKQPQNSYQQVAVLSYYLKKKSDEPSVNKDFIETANQDAGGRTINDITTVLNDAKNKYGFFGAGTGGKKILLAHGEDVVEALPDQEKVKKLMKSNSRKSKRRTKNNNKKAKKK